MWAKQGMWRVGSCKVLQTIQKPIHFMMTVFQEYDLKLLDSLMNQLKESE